MPPKRSLVGVLQYLQRRHGHLVQDVVDFFEPQAEVAAHVFAVRAELAFDGLEQVVSAASRASFSSAAMTKVRPTRSAIPSGEASLS